MKAVLAEVGYADALLARETPDGGLLLIDGHLRAETTPDQEVPVLILDVDEAEADKLLATLDPLSAMAGADDAKLAELLQSVKTEQLPFPAQEMLTRLAGDAASVSEAAVPADENPNLETRYAIVVNCESEQQQLELLEGI